MTDAAVLELEPLIGIGPACRALGRSRAGFYRHRRPGPRQAPATSTPRPQPRARAPAERAELLSLLHHPDHVDEAPASVDARLLDEGRYLASVSTM
ncbi:MAG: putative transposase [Rhodospirillaceae bacterium]|jgi:putative transposase|nr:putative transposase [Rhodospirillaceae bacterium]